MTHAVIVTGATGLLGRGIVKAFERDSKWKVVRQGFTRASAPNTIKVDLLNEQEVDNMLDTVKPKVVVHCAANRSSDDCAADPEAARKLNVFVTKHLAEATFARSCLLIYISTDYVFPGRPGEAPYEADSKTEPVNFYGVTKRDGELAVLESSPLGISLRVPVLYGSAEKNSESAVNVLIDAVWKAAQNSDAAIQMDDWALRYPTNTEDVGRVVQDIADLYLGAWDKIPSLPRVLQFSSEDRMTKHGICEVFAEILGVPTPGLVRDKQGGSTGAVQRPYDTHLSTKVLKELGIDVHTQDFKAWWRRELNAIRH